MKDLKHNLKALLMLVLSLQLAIPTHVFASSDKPSDGKFTAKVITFVSNYKKRNPTKDFNEKEIAALLDQQDFDTAMRTWGTEKLEKNKTEDSTARFEQQEKMNALVSEANQIIDELFNDTLFGSSKPSPEVFNAYLFELYSFYVREPHARPALELFFKVLRDKRFSDEQVKQMEKNKTIEGNIASSMNGWVFFSGLTAVVVARQFPKSKNLLDKVFIRYERSWRAMSKADVAATNKFVTNPIKSVIQSGPVQKIVKPVQEGIIKPIQKFGKKTNDAIHSRIENSRFVPNFVKDWFKKPTPVVKAQPVNGKGQLGLPSPTSVKPVKVSGLVGTERQKIEKQFLTSMAKQQLKAFEKQNGRKPTEAEEKVIQGKLAQTLKEVRALNIKDANQLRSILQQAESFMARTGRAPHKDVVAQFRKKAGLSLVSVQSAARSTLRITSTSAELIVRHTKNLMSRSPSQMMADMGKFMGVYGSGVGAYAAARYAYFKLPNTQYTLIPETVLDQAIRGMSVLQLTCQSETLGRKMKSLLDKVDIESNPADIKAQFVPLVASLKQLSSDYALLQSIASQYTNDVESVMPLPQGMKFDNVTGVVSYNASSAKENKNYTVTFECPTRIGKDIKYISLNEANRVLQATKDKASVVDMSNDVTTDLSVEEISALADRLLRVNPTDYNTGVELLVDRLFSGDASVLGVISVLDEKLLNPATIIDGQPVSNVKRRKTAESFIDSKKKAKGV